MIERAVVDTSIVVKWYVPEHDSPAATTLPRQQRQFLAPDLMVCEFGNVLWKKVRQGKMTQVEAEEVADSFVGACPVTLRPTATLLRPAMDIALRFGRSVYDSIYLALALSEGCPLLTADARFVQALAGTELQSSVRLLASEDADDTDSGLL